MADDGVLFRKARRSDLQAIVAMLADDPIGATREDPGDAPAPAYADAFEAIDGDERQELIVAERDGAIVGTLQLTFIPGLSRGGMWRALIEGVRIARDARGAGLGSRLIERAVERATERGCGLVQLTSDKRRQDAIRFYEELGFRSTHEGMKLIIGEG